MCGKFLNPLYDQMNLKRGTWATAVNNKRYDLNKSLTAPPPLSGSPSRMFALNTHDVWLLSLHRFASHRYSVGVLFTRWPTRDQPPIPSCFPAQLPFPRNDPITGPRVSRITPSQEDGGAYYSGYINTVIKLVHFVSLLSVARYLCNAS